MAIEIFNSLGVTSRGLLDGGNLVLRNAADSFERTARRDDDAF